MRAKTNALLLLLVLIGLFAGWVFYDRFEQLFSPAERISIQRPAEESADEGSVPLPMPARHPVKPPAKVPGGNKAPLIAPLPFPSSLAEADAYLNERLPQLIAERKLLTLVNLNYFIPKLVLFIDNLPEKSLPRLHLPIIPPKPGFITSGQAENMVIGQRNAARYSPYVLLVEAIPDAPLLQLYRGLYPLFQQAYRDGGDPHGHFNDRLIQVIDDLLATPEPPEPLALSHHVSRFKYADESLEMRSAGQKILLRMGRANARRVKEKLQRLRQKLVRQDW